MEQRHDLHCVLLEPPVAQIQVLELLLGHSKGMLKLGSDMA